MKHKIPEYIRNGRTITQSGRSTPEVFPSISAAKKRSLALQKANGGRGSGYVRVGGKK